MVKNVRKPVILRVARNGWKRFLARRNYKDRLFIRLFHDKKALLELYNALNGTHYTNPDDLEITTIDDVVYLGMKNDCSFIIGEYVNLYEQQSTFCKNMPIRGLIYLAGIYQGYIAQHEFNLYGTQMISLPTPRYIVFYNGTEDRPEREELHLSEAFAGKRPCLECTVEVININKGKNQELMRQCRTLEGYSVFIGKVREFQEAGAPLEDAVDNACIYCIDNDFLKDFLLKHRNEVRKVLLTEYDAKKQRKMDIRDARTQGREEGLEEGRNLEKKAQQLDQIRWMTKKIQKGWSLEMAADALEADPERLRPLYEAVQAAGPEYDAAQIFLKLHPSR